MRRWAILMDFPRLDSARRADDAERRLILVDIAPRQQGIAAALRRAFETVETRDGCEFDRLLRRLA